MMPRFASPLQGSGIERLVSNTYLAATLSIETPPEIDWSSKTDQLGEISGRQTLSERRWLLSDGKKVSSHSAAV